MFDSQSGRRSRGDGDGARLFTVGLLLGAVVGATAALLMAPASGEQTRSMLRKRGRKIARQGREALEDGWQDAERTARRAARLGLKRARTQAARARGLAEDFVDSGKRRLGVD